MEPNLWPVRTPKEIRERAIGEVYGLLHMTYPEITREQVAKIYDLRQEKLED